MPGPVDRDGVDRVHGAPRRPQSDRAGAGGGGAGGDESASGTGSGGGTYATGGTTVNPGQTLRIFVGTSGNGGSANTAGTSGSTSGKDIAGKAGQDAPNPADGGPGSGSAAYDSSVGVLLHAIGGSDAHAAGGGTGGVGGYPGDTSGSDCDYGVDPFGQFPPKYLFQGGEGGQPGQGGVASQPSTAGYAQVPVSSCGSSTLTG